MLLPRRATAQGGHEPNTVRARLLDVLGRDHLEDGEELDIVDLMKTYWLAAIFPFSELLS